MRDGRFSAAVEAARTATALQDLADELSDEASAAVGRVLPRISRAVLAASGARDFNVLQNNGEAAYQSVFHVHFHIIPKLEDGSGLAWPFKSTELDPDEGARMAEQIRNLLE